MISAPLFIGLDAGSTTVKVVVTDANHAILFKEYRRHLADVAGTIASVLTSLFHTLGDVPVSITITGSAGMGVAERCKLPFIQEVVASCELIQALYPTVKTLVDIGGEDAKMIFFSENQAPDMRMNGNCAGGTGSFIDQIASLLGVGVHQLDELAQQAQSVYPIASRCGVFSKTDVQNLLSRNVSKADIALSVFHAVTLQVVSSLSRGYSVAPPLFLSGGPFTFIPTLRKVFIEQLGVDSVDVIDCEDSQFIPAWGAAVESHAHPHTILLSLLIQQIEQSNKKTDRYQIHSLPPLFKNNEAYTRWLAEKESQCIIDTISIQEASMECFIGIDSGSTTTKIVAIDDQHRVFFRFYERNSGSSLHTVQKGLELLLRTANEANKKLVVVGSCVTGYGEDLVKNAFALQHGMVETLAHYTAAYHFNPKVSFILDIGGQDMKASFIENGIIKRLDINEACSSGCGSFIETFAQSLGYTAAQFSELSLQAKYPYDLGTRCTVFMNSKVKQALREGTSVADIAAGLGYSVVKNCLNKVLKINDFSALGSHIMVQGGTFRNRAVLRALENEIGNNVMVTNMPELMGAYGAALYAKKHATREYAISLEQCVQIRPYSCKTLMCKGCENDCLVTRYQFEQGNRFYAGNKCEKIFANTGKRTTKGVNAFDYKYQLLFNRAENKNAQLTLGIPRALGIYENYPFWHALFSACGIKVVLSDTSTLKLHEKGAHTVMADNICFPAKLTNGHILNLMEKKPDRIFLPFVVYENQSDTKTPNSYNCPIVTGYSEVVRSAIDPLSSAGIPFDSPSFNFKNKKLLKKACDAYLFSMLPELTKKQLQVAFKEAEKQQALYEQQIADYCQQVADNAQKENRLLVLVGSRPYHTDPLIQHKIADIIADFGADVITEDIVRFASIPTPDVHMVMQWAYTNRIVKAASWVAQHAGNVQYMQLTSFGCGPDAFIIDEVGAILQRAGKNATVLKIDDINNVGSTRLRIRSLIESVGLKSISPSFVASTIQNTPYFEKKDIKRKILLPWFADFYSPFIPPIFHRLGYEAENLPPSDMESVAYGLKYSNNEICYPATLVVGDFMKALESGKYNRNEIALGISQTGGQCRATNYISLMKKAMIAAGFDDIPVISVGVSGTGVINEQPGFEVKWHKVLKLIIATMGYADCLSQLYYSTAPRERIKGEAERLKEKYIHLGVEAVENHNTRELNNLLKSAAKEFLDANTLRDIPRMGIVGEIYVKYNNFGHKNITHWLISQGVEPVLPPLSAFFTETFASRKARVDGYIDHKKNNQFVMNWAERYVFSILKKMEACVSDYPYYIPVTNPHHDAVKASKIINLNTQFGEGWRIPAEFAHFAEHGINHVISLQPFGCIANHIISKGIEKRTRELYPKLQLLQLDFDSSMGEANIFNRLHFMIRNAQKEKM